MVANLSYPEKKDLCVLVADRDMELTIRSLLNRHQALRIRPTSFEVVVHLEHDPGCLLHAAEFLRSRSELFDYAMVIFDKDGCGDDSPRVDLQNRVSSDLRRNGWSDRAATVVIEPELEVWIWSGSNELPGILGHSSMNYAQMKEALSRSNWWPKEYLKPPDPKQAFQWLCKEGAVTKSSDLFRQMAERISFRDCTDLAFEHFLTTLREWFPPNTEV